MNKLILRAVEDFFRRTGSKRVEGVYVYKLGKRLMISDEPVDMSIYVKMPQIQTIESVAGAITKAVLILRRIKLHSLEPDSQDDGTNK